VHLVFLSLLIGLVICIYPWPFLRTVAQPVGLPDSGGFTYLFRGTPLLIQLYIHLLRMPRFPGIQKPSGGIFP